MAETVSRRHPWGCPRLHSCFPPRDLRPSRGCPAVAHRDSRGASWVSSLLGLTITRRDRRTSTGTDVPSPRRLAQDHSSEIMRTRGRTAMGYLVRVLMLLLFAAAALAYAQDVRPRRSGPLHRTRPSHPGAPRPRRYPRVIAVCQRLPGHGPGRQRRHGLAGSAGRAPGGHCQHGLDYPQLPRQCPRDGGAHD
jgi:hypothetical protein